MLNGVCEHGFLRRSCSICDLEQENKILRNALNDILNPMGKWFDYKEEHGKEISYQEYVRSVCKKALEQI